MSDVLTMVLEKKDLKYVLGDSNTMRCDRLWGSLQKYRAEMSPAPGSPALTLVALEPLAGPAASFSERQSHDLEEYRSRLTPYLKDFDHFLIEVHEGDKAKVRCVCCDLIFALTPSQKNPFKSFTKHLVKHNYGHTVDCVTRSRESLSRSTMDVEATETLVSTAQASAEAERVLWDARARGWSATLQVVAPGFVTCLLCPLLRARIDGLGASIETRMREHIESPGHFRAQSGGIQGRIDNIFSSQDSNAGALTRESLDKRWCYGFWQRHSRDQSGCEPRINSLRLMREPGMRGAEWYVDPGPQILPEALFDIFLGDITDRTVIDARMQARAEEKPEPKLQINITLRSCQCLRVRCGDDVQFREGMCAHCAKIPRLDDFRAQRRRLENSVANESNIGQSKVNNMYLTPQLQLAKLKRISEDRRRLRQLCFYTRLQLVHSRQRLIDVKEEIGEGIQRADLKKLYVA